LLGVPLAILLTLGWAYFHYHTVPELRATLSGVVAAAAGMALSMGFKLIGNYLRQPSRCCSGPALCRRQRPSLLAAGGGARTRAAGDGVLLATRYDAAGARGASVSDGKNPLLTIAAVFASLSLVSIGGGNTVLPEIHRAAVQREQWMTDQQFADIYAISEAAPGPSSMISSLVGYKAAGLLARSWPSRPSSGRRRC
jgi:chromate transport protein ChrA